MSGHGMRRGDMWPAAILSRLCLCPQRWCGLHFWLRVMVKVKEHSQI